MLPLRVRPGRGIALWRPPLAVSNCRLTAGITTRRTCACGSCPSLAFWIPRLRSGLFPPVCPPPRDAGLCTSVELAAGFTPTRGTPTEKQGFGRLHVDQSAQIYVDYEQVAPVARCRESRAVSPMNSSASVDHPPVGAEVRRRDSNPCNPHRVSS